MNASPLPRFVASDPDPSGAGSFLFLRAERLLAQRFALEKLHPLRMVRELGLDAAFRQIAEVFAAALDVGRVSIWRLDPTRQRCERLELTSRGASPAGPAEFCLEAVPEYFAAMIKEGVVAASDARADHRTAEFRGTYLEPLGIRSMLDTLIYVRGEVYGILCAEASTERQWENDEKTFAISVSNIVSLCVEQSEHEATTRRVAEAHDRLATVLAATTDSIWDLDLRTNAHWFSSNFGAKFGHREEVFESGLNSWLQHVHPEDQRRAYKDFSGALAGAADRWIGEYRFKRADGSYADVLDRAAIKRDESGKAIRVIGAMTDISELRKSEARFRLATLATHEVIWEWDMRTNAMWWSDAMKALGWVDDGLLKRSFDACLGRIPQPDRERVLAAVAKATSNRERNWTAEHRLQLDDGRIVAVVNRAYIEYDADGAPLLMIGSIQDITEKQELEAKFLRAQRLESIGALASGIAHDLNNVLAPILLGSQLLEAEGANPAFAAILKQVRSSAERGADIVRQLLTFARGAESEQQTIPLTPILRDIVKIARQTFPKNISVSLEAPTGLWHVNGNLTQLHQVFLNLCVNARDAMPDGGKLTLSAKNVEVTGADHAEVAPGSYVSIVVTDTGTGMSHEALSKIFVPFFTTKGPQKGTGLGLSTVLGIVKGHKGWIEVKSSPGAGASFTILLPASPRADAAAPSPEGRHEQNGSGRTILVVDDEQAIRETTAALLRMHGYRAVTASHGGEALAILTAPGASVDLVLADLQMPYLDGMALARSIRQFLPGLKIMVCSGIAAIDGAAGESMTQELERLEITAPLQKPFTASDLLAAIESKLSATPNPAVCA